jgi:hypothetical protein
MSLTRVTLATASSVLVLAALAGCGNSDAAADGANDTAQAADGAPGVSGKVAAIRGRTAQVQNDATGQVAVTWTDQTDISQEVDATLDDVSVGSCVAVGSTSDETGEDVVTADSVRISAAVDGSCGGGSRGGPGEPPSGAPTDRPSDLPSDRPSNPSGDGPARMMGAFGEVAAVSADGFTVTATQPGSEETRQVEVTVTGDTTYSKSADADSSALEVGRCVTASGDADDTGALTADRISVSDAVDGRCASVMTGRPGQHQ